MYMFINALILALLVPSGSAQKAEDGPACRAELSGQNLLTTVDFPTGFSIEGPWRVVHRGDMEGERTNYVMFATLDRVIEIDELTGGRHIVPFPQPINLAFEGADQRELIQRAARIWCVTVMRAQENQQLQRLSPSQAFHTRVAALPSAGGSES